jgi:uncharacterized protein (DUF4415 family)
VDDENLPPISAAEKARFDNLSLSDATIDYSDTPFLGEAAWKHAERGKFYRPLKKQVTVRLDTSVIDWFKRKAKNGKGYQTDINRVLAEYVAAQQKKAG